MMSFAATPATAINPWIQILAALEKKINRQSFETWFKPTRYSHITGRKLYVRIPTPEFHHIGDKYFDLIQEAVDLQKLELDEVTFVTIEEDPSQPPIRKDGGFGPVPTHAASAPMNHSGYSNPSNHSAHAGASSRRGTYPAEQQ